MGHKGKTRGAKAAGLEPKTAPEGTASAKGQEAAREDELFRRAVTLHQQGNLPEAEELYRTLLKSHPDHFELLQLTGVLNRQTGRLEEAAGLMQRSLALNPNQAHVHNNLGNCLQDLKRFAEALACYERAVALQPDYEEAWYNGGHTLQDLGRHEEALGRYAKAVALKPGHAEAHFQCGNVLQQLGRHAEALAAYERALDLGLGHAEVHYQRGNCLQALQRSAEALACYEKSLALRPDHAAVCNNRGNALRDLKRFGEALASYRRAAEIDPAWPEVYGNIGNALQELGRHGEALAAYDRVIASKPDYAEAHYNRGIALQELRRFAEALAAYDKAVALKPDYVDAQWNKARLLILTGRYREGWRLFEWRWQKDDVKPLARNFAQPLWLGDADPKGKRILLWAEQGLGDTIQMARYVPLLLARGAEVLIEVPGPLVSLIAGIPGVTQVIAKGEALPAFDLQCPLMSLPVAFETGLETIPAEVPYLRAPEAKSRQWQERLGAKTRRRIGLVWSGAPGHRNDRNRSIPLEALLPLLEAAADCYSLQKECRDADRELLLREGRIRDYSGEILDFADTAGLVSQLDLVITVDTSVAHLAGALGKEVWILLPYSPDYRWAVDREDCPWYPTARLFRQGARGDWAGVIGRVGAELGLAAPAPAAGGPRAEEAAACQDAPQPRNETERRKAVIRQGRTDEARWADPGNLEAAWQERSRIAATWIPAGAKVLDIGCGAMTLERHLPEGCTYIPCDVVRRDERTERCDLNRGEIPSRLAEADRVTMLGVLEYLYDPRPILLAAAQAGRTLLFSYCLAEYSAGRDRGALGWVNAYSRADLHLLAAEAGYRVKAEARIDAMQDLIVLEPEAGQPPPRRVVVLSYCNTVNFGDRLGYHLLNSLLPAHATVRHIHHKPWEPVEGEIDLLIVGLGNSLFGQLLTDELEALIKRAKASLGIFGTQYRDGFSAQRMRRVVDSLDVWFARYEEDYLLYGTRSDSQYHLGDWLIDAFAMAEANDETTLKIGEDIWQEYPLDRVIQRIQRYRKVHSTRLHPLLCAMTSAQEVAYTEQRESATKKPSGKFASMLIDVFGRPFPEERFWEVDRDSVRAYKARVQQNMRTLRRELERLLG